MKIVKWPWPLTFILPWPWVWPLTLTIWRFFFFHFFPFSLKSRYAKTWRRTSNGWSLTESPFYKEHFAANQKSVPLPVQNLWPIMWFLQKWWPWPWSLSDFHQKILPGSLELSTSAVKISERLSQWCGLYIVQLRTDRQTDRQTDRHTAVTNILCKNLQFCKVINRGDNRVF